MEQLCRECGLSLGDTDVFCGNCGAQASSAPDGTGPAPAPPLGAPPLGAAAAVGTAAAQGAPQPVAYQVLERPAPPSRTDDADLSGRFFSHAPSRPPGPMSNSTRYLCAAAYVDPGFANLVIGELTASHRAVVPSRGIDLVPITRHCLNARKMQLVRDLLLSLWLMIALFVSPVTTVFIWIVGFLVGGKQRRPGVNRSALGKSATAIGLLIILVCVVSVLGFLYLASHLLSELAPLVSNVLVLLVVLLCYFGLVSAVLVTYSYVRNRTLAERLRPGAGPPRFARRSGRIEARIAEVGAAQHGNVTLFNGQNPFLGAGGNPFIWDKERAANQAWSIAIELDRARAGTGDTASGGAAPRAYAPIDPVALHRVLRERLLRLKDPDLPEHERISALNVDDHIVAEGLRPWDSPLIDPVRKIPYSAASPEAIESLIRHSQANLRYYQRVSVSDEGQAVRARRGLVMGSTDQELVVSAFVYAAVEGRMFYLEFVPAVLSPILLEYHAPNWLPKLSSGKFFWQAVKDAVSTALADLALAPLRVVATVRMMMAESRAYREEVEATDDYEYADIGARISVRERGALTAPRTYIQRLDASKYTQIIERLVTETVLDFLEANDVDTTAYRTSAQMVINNSVSITDSPGSAVNTGRGGTASGRHGK
jgi:hypothetical protein